MDAMPPWLLAASLGLFLCLSALAWIDHRHFILPDWLNLPLVPAGLAVAWAIDPARFLDHLAGAALGLGGMAAVSWGYRAWKGRDGLGFGDAKLMAAAGAWVAWQGLPSVLLLASASALLLVLAAAVVRRRAPAAGDRLAFGPHLCLGLWLVWMLGPVEMAS